MNLANKLSFLSKQNSSAKGKWLQREWEDF